MVLVQMVLAVAVGIYGPLGLLAGFRLVVLGRPLRRRAGTILIAAPLLLAAVMIIGMTSFGAGLWGSGVNFLNALVLLATLPALGAAHLLKLGGARSQQKRLPEPG